MKQLTLMDAWFHGAVSLEHRQEGIKPWRIPYADYALYPPDGIEGKAEICAGVRLRLHTDSSALTLTFTPLPEAAAMDCLIDGRLFLSLRLPAGETSAVFGRLPAGGGELEIYLPQNIGLTVTGLWIDDAAAARPLPDTRPRWVTYGSSITQCVAASSPSRTWPAIAAARSGYNLTCLGFSGNCQLEPMAGRLIASLPADLITLCVGVNVYGAATLSPRVFAPALIGILLSIRERHPLTPLFVISPVYGSERETEPNKLGFTLPMMREEIARTVEVFRARGDSRVHYRDGLSWFGASDSVRLPDGLHPDAEGYELLGARFAERILR
ncbi:MULTISPECIES: GDSL-type esterase/lipase family protein [unclassified Paenibacillus]|uniref:GDSL-type esterase/lipase family protein n=1 Tax=unclassified Paenibacillus TaxID=185978 RepID=UPI0030FB0915